MRFHAVNDTNTKSHTQQRLSYLKHANIHTNILIYTEGLRNFVYINMQFWLQLLLYNNASFTILPPLDCTAVCATATAAVLDFLLHGLTTARMHEIVTTGSSSLTITRK